MIYDILYVVTIRCKDTQKSEQVLTYELYAKTSEEAKTLAKEIFLAEYDLNGVLYVEAEPFKISEMEQMHINRQLINTIGVLNDKFQNLNSVDFLMMFRKFGGFNMKTTDADRKFCFKFMGFTCEAFLKNDGITSGINLGNVVYYSEKYNRTYIIKEDLTKIYVGV